MAEQLTIERRKWEGPLTPYAQQLVDKAVRDLAVLGGDQSVARKLADEYVHEFADYLEPILSTKNKGEEKK